MSEKDRCLRMAEECERMAKRTASAEDRNTLRNMAQLWRELAGTSATVEWVEELQPTRRTARPS